MKEKARKSGQMCTPVAKESYSAPVRRLTCVFRLLFFCAILRTRWANLQNWRIYDFIGCAALL